MKNVLDIILGIGCILAGPYLWLFKAKTLAGLEPQAFVHGFLVVLMLWGAWCLNNTFNGEDSGED